VGERVTVGLFVRVAVMVGVPVVLRVAVGVPVEVRVGWDPVAVGRRPSQALPSKAPSNRKPMTRKVGERDRRRREDLKRRLQGREDPIKRDGY
jgi:hypothetical protein